jgi:hypothetical protein
MAREVRHPLGEFSAVPGVLGWSIAHLALSTGKSRGILSRATIRGGLMASDVAVRSG